MALMKLNCKKREVLWLLTVQILKERGYKVVGIDIDNKKIQAAEELECEYLINAKRNNTEDMVLVLTGFRGQALLL